MGLVWPEVAVEAGEAGIGEEDRGENRHALLSGGVAPEGDSPREEAEKANNIGVVDGQETGNDAGVV